MSDAQPRPDDLLYRILLAPPQSTTIPLFAMSFEAGRPAYDVQAGAEPKVPFNGNLLRSLAGRIGPHSFLEIRHRRSSRSAIYASWLGFAAQSDAENFVSFIRPGKHGLDAMIDRTQRELEDARRMFEAHVAGGLFDLGRLEENRRRKQADLYVRLDDEIAKLGRQSAGLRQFRKSPFGDHAGVSIG